LLADDCVFEDFGQGVTLRRGDEVIAFMKRFASAVDAELVTLTSFGDRGHEACELLVRLKQNTDASGAGRGRAEEISGNRVVWVADVVDGAIVSVRDYLAAQGG
jgi:hypothetical protein